MTFEWGPALISNSSCSILGWTSPGLTMFWTVRWYSWPLKISVHKWRVTVPAVVVLWLWGLTLLRAEGEKKLNIFSFSLVLFVTGPSSTRIGPLFSLSLLSLLTYFTSSFLLLSATLAVFNFYWVLALHAISCVCEHIWSSCKFWYSRYHPIFFSSWVPRGIPC